MKKGDTKQVRAGLYARVSTVGHGQDVGLQLEELRSVANQRGWKVTEYVDEGVSGAKEDRPALNRLMAAARAGQLDVVVCWKFDRFARSTRHLLEALEVFRNLGVQFVSLREAVDTTSPMGKAMFSIIAAISELERELIKERIAAGVARARAKGVRFGRPRRDVDVEAAQRMLHEGRSQREIAVALHVPRSTLRHALGRSRPAGSKALRKTA